MAQQDEPANRRTERILLRPVGDGPLKIGPAANARGFADGPIGPSLEDSFIVFDGAIATD
jgi:hypothetical protein